MLQIAIDLKATFDIIAGPVSWVTNDNAGCFECIEKGGKTIAKV